MSNEHTVKSYEEELQFLKDSLIKMGSLTESQLSDAMDAVIKVDKDSIDKIIKSCLLYTSPSPRDVEESRMPSSA